MALTVDTTFGAGRVSVKPIEYGAYGHYRANLVTGATVSLTAGDPIASFRWTSATANAVLLRATLNASITSNITTAVPCPLELIKATGFTASDSAGTSSQPGSTQKNKSTMGNSLVGDLRVATTGKLTAGTRTLDALGFAYAIPQFTPNVTNAGSASYPVDMYIIDTFGAHPMVFTANEGFILRAPVAGNTSGGVQYTLTIDWAEVPVPQTGAVNGF